VTPVATTTPRLEQEFRADFLWRTAPNGDETTVYDNGKGLELIPATPLELIVNLPAYTVHRNPKAPDGWGDWPLLVKYRIAAGNEAHGDYIVSAFLGATVPTGGRANGNRWPVLSPTIAPGKGWGSFDIQSTVAVTIPTGNAAVVGHPLVYNVTVQEHVDRFFWPEVEVNGTSWRDGANIGRNQVFITPGIVFGRFPIHDRLGVTVGAGVQIAATTYKQYDHTYTLTLRMPF
jgi:hypothetical protein